MNKKQDSKSTFSLVLKTLLIVLIIGLMVFLVLRLMKENGFFDNEEPSDKSPDYTEVERKELTYQISGLHIDKSLCVAYATVDAVENCRLKIRLVDEESYFSDEEPELRYLDCLTGETEVIISVGDGETTEDSVKTLDVEISLVGMFPEYFVAEAQLFNANGETLGDPIYNIKNSERYARFMAITPEDFSENDTIVSFESNSNSANSGQSIQNFGVLADNVKVITAEAISHPKYWDDSYHENIYEIVAPSEEIKRGDYVYVSDGTSAEIFCVWDAWWDENSDNTLCVYPQINYTTVDAQSYDLMHFYKFIRCDMSLISQDAEPEGPMLASYTKKDINEKKKLKDIHIKGLEYDDDAVSVNVDIEDITVGAVGYLIYAPEIFDDDYFECEIKGSVNFTLSAEFAASVSGDSAESSSMIVKFPKILPIKIPTPLVGLLLTVEFDIGVSGEMSGVLYINDAPIYGKAGFRYTSAEGFKSLERSGGLADENNEKDYVSCVGKASVNFGPSATFGIEYIHGLLSFKAEVSSGVCVYAVVDSIRQHNRGSVSLIHQCDLCVDGSVELKYGIELSFGSKIGILARMMKKDDLKKNSKLDKVGWYPLKQNVLDVNINLCNSFISLDGEDGNPTFGIGDCQNYTLNLPISQVCHNYEDFWCQAELLDTDPELKLKQEEAGYHDSYHSSDRIWRQTESIPDGKHEHNGQSFTITITDNTSGDVLFTKEVVIERNNEGAIVPKNDLFAEIPLSCQDFHVEVKCVCTVRECAMTIWYPDYPVGSQQGNDIFYPIHRIEHNVEYDITHNLEVVCGSSYWGDVNEQQEHLDCRFKFDSEIHGPFGIAYGDESSVVLEWNYNDLLMKR